MTSFPDIQYRRPAILPPNTPWGPSQHREQVAPGIVCHSTAGHGGYHLNGMRMEAFRLALPTFKTFCGQPEWFEEDCDVAAVVIVFSHLFEDQAVYHAAQMVTDMADSPRYVEKWGPVAQFITDHPERFTHRIQAFQQAVATKWRRCGMSSCDEGWLVYFSRGQERRTYLFLDYPKGGTYYTEADLEAEGAKRVSE